MLIFASAQVIASRHEKFSALPLKAECTSKLFFAGRHCEREKNPHKDFLLLCFKVSPPPGGTTVKEGDKWDKLSKNEKKRKVKKKTNWEKGFTAGLQMDPNASPIKEQR